MKSYSNYQISTDTETSVKKISVIFKQALNVQIIIEFRVRNTAKVREVIFFLQAYDIFRKFLIYRA